MTDKTGRNLAPMTDTTARESLLRLDPNTVDFEEAARVRGYIDHEAVDRLAQSIKLTGQAQPILCIADPVSHRFVLVDGLHRLLACRKLNIEVNAQHINKTWFQSEPELLHTAMLQMELDSILVRAEVTQEQRERLMAAHIENRDKLVRLRDGEDDAPSGTNGPPNKRTNGPPKPRGNAKEAQWFTEAYTAVGMAKQTARRKWADFLKAFEREHIPPSKATQEDKDGFAAYLKGNAEEAQQKAAEAQQKAKEQALERLRAAINTAVNECLRVCSADEVAAVLTNAGGQRYGKG